MVEDHAEDVLRILATQRGAIVWAREQGHRPLLARVLHLKDKKVPEHSRDA